MESSPASNTGTLLGRFIVELGGQRHTGLTAEEVLALLDAGPAENVAIYRIHRLVDAGRMELVGVRREQLERPDGMFFFRRDAAGARADFDAIMSAAADQPPPCRIELELSHTTACAPPHVVALLFCAACTEGVGQWLQRLGLRPGDRADGGPSALRAYREANVRPLERAVFASTPSSVNQETPE